MKEALIHMAKVETLERIFKHGQLILEDIDPSMTPEQIKDHYAGIYNELTQAVIEGPNFTAEAEEYVFRKAVGTKGVTLKEIAAGNLANIKPAKFSVVREERQDIMRLFTRALKESNNSDYLLPKSETLPPV
jgi:PRTRC genetic system protein C